VRDARPEGRQERGPRRDRDLAGRSRHLIEDVLRLAAAIVLDAAAFVLWNLTVRSPARLVSDLATGLRSPAVLLRGAARTLTGLLLLGAAAAVLNRVALETHTFLVLETWTLVTGLLVEALVGAGRPARDF
jgi:hypothetical protein